FAPRRVDRLRPRHPTLSDEAIENRVCPHQRQPTRAEPVCSEQLPVAEETHVPTPIAPVQFGPDELVAPADRPDGLARCFRLTSPHWLIGGDPQHPLQAIKSYVRRDRCV